ncbi:MAG: tRNA dihydrouridine synthase DusB [Eubacteriales bacterium]|nr:tRNA dihydrouridine synthase DusB [Eubacteriales bacterium]
MYIGKTEIKHGIILAPMAGITDHAFRIMCKRQGAPYMVSEMISSKALHYGDNKTAMLAAITDEEQPMALQIFGSEPEIMAEAALSLSEQFNPAAIDINMGCPVRKVVSNGEGSALMRNLPLATAVIRSVADAVKIPVTVKLRSGWDENSVNAVEAAKIAEDAGAAAVCIHGRTKTQMYRSPVDLSVIRDVKQAITIPVIGNGGIICAADALLMFRETGCDAVMVARGACGNPWIFSHIIAALENKPIYYPERREYIEAAIIHADMLVADKGFRGVCEARKHVAWYIKDMPGSAKIRHMLNSATSLDEIKTILYNYI